MHTGTRTIIALGIGLLCGGVVTSCGKARVPAADLVVPNGHVYSMAWPEPSDEGLPWPELVDAHTHIAELAETLQTPTFGVRTRSSDHPAQLARLRADV